MPFAEFTKLMSYEEMTALTAPHCSTLYIIGGRDTIMDHDEGGAAVVRDQRTHVIGANRLLWKAGDKTRIQGNIMGGDDHRPYFLSRRAVSWMQEYIQPTEHHQTIPKTEILFGKWVDSQGQRIEKLYNTEARERGLRVPDIEAVWRSPRELACFPEQEKPSPEYTMKGWVESIAGVGSFDNQK
jgi:hypothetical protein